MEAEIVVAGPGDAENLAGLHYLSHTESFAAFVPAEWVAGRVYADYVVRWTAILDDDMAEPLSCTWKAGVGGEVVGMVHVEPSTGGEAQLANIHVHPVHQRKGIGRLLMDAASGFIRACGYSAASLGVVEANTGARALYESCGWTVRERRDNGPEGVPILIYEITL